MEGTSRVNAILRSVPLVRAFKESAPKVTDTPLAVAVCLRVRLITAIAFVLIICTTVVFTLFQVRSGFSTKMPRFDVFPEALITGIRRVYE